MELKQLHTNDKDSFIGFAESRVGGRSENQDSFGFKLTHLGFVLTVCDGMGGGPGGKTASTIAVKEIISGIDEANDDEEVSNIIIKAIRKANMAIYTKGEENKKLKGMGSTASVLLLSDHSGYIAHVGDSRVYQLRGKEKIFRTFDHSMVFEYVRQGRLTEEQARLSANSNIITRALGIVPDVEVDIQEVPYEKGDRFMLCTDGIHGTMPEKKLIKLVAGKRNPLGSVVDDIATLIDNMGRTDGGGHDNLTLAIVETKKDSELKTKMTRKTRIMLLALAVICAASIGLNIVQALSNSNKDNAHVNQKTVPVQVTDSIKNNKQM